MPYAWGKKALIPKDRRATLVTEKRKFLAPACNHDLKSPDKNLATTLTELQLFIICQKLNPRHQV
jgi:hypothetical protein